jgi:hypothetical protein
MLNSFSAVVRLRADARRPDFGERNSLTLSAC